MAYSAEETHETTGARFGMWLFLASEVFLFVGPLILYFAYRYRYPVAFGSASASLDLTLGTINTAVLITSSLLMTIALKAAREGKRGLSAALIGVTIALALFFLFNKYTEWAHEIGKGAYPGSEALLQRPQGEAVFFGLYYFLTGLHGAHVLAGAGLMAFMLHWVLKGKAGENDIRLENAALYWHMVDIVWLYLFPAFYLA